MTGLSRSQPTRKDAAPSSWGARHNGERRLVHRGGRGSFDRQGACVMYTVERIDPSTTALIVVDMQNDFVAPGAPLESPAGRAMLPRLQQALACCREHGIPVIYTAHVHRPGGCDQGLLAHDLRISRGEALVDGSPGAAIFPEI